MSLTTQGLQIIKNYIEGRCNGAVRILGKNRVAGSER